MRGKVKKSAADTAKLDPDLAAEAAPINTILVGLF
jgi:hypothetical protein